MGDRTGISWSEATWNPIRGCSKVSEGCGTGDGECYAIGMVHRGLQPHDKGLTIRTPSGTEWTGEVNRAPDSIFYKPLAWARPRRIFPTSLSDPFHESLTIDQMAEMWAVMALAHWHTFQLLTKRSKRMRDVLNDPDFPAAVRTHATYLYDQMKGGVAGRGRRMLEGNPWLGLSHRGGTGWVEMPWPLPNVWCGVSIELGKYAFRAEHLKATPAVVRWVSAEPLMGDLDEVILHGLDWVVVGGMSGAGAVRMDPEWARCIRDRCAATMRLVPCPDDTDGDGDCATCAGRYWPYGRGLHPASVAFHMKQTGEVLAREWGLESKAGHDPAEWPAEFQIREYPR